MIEELPPDPWLGWTGPGLVVEVPVLPVPMDVTPTTATAPSPRDLITGLVSYSCERDEHGRCSTYPGKTVYKHPRGSGVRLPAAEIAPSCVCSCHGN